MSRGSPRIPYLDRGRYVPSPAAPDVSVRIRATRGNPPRAALLRIYRAVGAVADHRGIAATLDVRLHCGRRAVEPRVELGDGAARIRLHTDHAALSPRALRILLDEAFDAAGVDGSSRDPEKTDRGRGRPGTVVLLENPFVDPDRPERPRPEMAGGTFQLASALRRDAVPVRMAAGRWCPHIGIEPWEPLDDCLSGPGSTLLGLTVLEGCFDAVRQLCAEVRRSWTGGIVLGGPMPTLAPLHTLAHTPGADLVVRGPGEVALPALARLLRGPMDRATQAALLGMEGVLYERDGVLLAGHTGRTPSLPPAAGGLDFTLLEERHLAHGLSLETARGCRHGCGFCTTPGRGRYLARSGAWIAEQLDAYALRLREVFGDRVPRVAQRIQLCDDDFACDRWRAREVLGILEKRGTELAALQASVRDFLGPGDDGLDQALLDAFVPGLFQDALHGRRWPPGTAPLAHQGDARGWVHLGVESFADAELARLGKGYGARDARAVVRALDERRVVHDAYLILANRDTSFDDLVDTLTAVVQLKIEHRDTFFVRRPAVPYLVPVFPSRRFAVLSAGRPREVLDDVLELAGTWSVDGHPEFDYPRVLGERPLDPDVDAAVAARDRWFGDGWTADAPAKGLERWLRDRLAEVAEPGRRRTLQRAVRRLGGIRKRLVLRGIARARSGELPRAVARRYWEAATGLGPAVDVVREARAVLETGDPRLVVIPTRDCSLRCTYCPSDKRPGCEMDAETLDAATELLLSTDEPSAILQFFGGEALLRRDWVLAGIPRALAAAQRVGKRLGVILSTNGGALDPDLLSVLEPWPVKIELSLDGDPGVQNRHRRPREAGGDSYAFVPRVADALIGSGIDHEVIMVVTPETVPRLADSFAHVVGLGFRRIQVNYALAERWSVRAKEALAAGLRGIEERFFAGDDLPGVEWINLRSFRHPMLLNGEITVDFDGTLHFGNGFLIRTADPDAFRAGHLDDLAPFDRYAALRPDNAHLIRHTYPPEVVRNNLQVGRIYGSFVRHMRERFPSLASVEPTRAPVGIPGEP